MYPSLPPRVHGPKHHPSFLSVPAPYARRIYKRTSSCLLQERIHHTRRELDTVSRALLQLHLHLARDLSADDLDIIEQLTTEKAFLPSHLLSLIFARLTFDPEDGRDTFHRNLHIRTTRRYFRRWKFSKILKSTIYSTIYKVTYVNVVD
jgi:hypothetical protein